MAGFSEGGLTALLVGIRHPSSVSAIVCDAGYDVLNPDAPALAMIPNLLGDSTEIDPDAIAQAFSHDPQMAAVMAMMQTDQDAAQGEGCGDIPDTHYRALVAVARLRLRGPDGDHCSDVGPRRRSRRLLLRRGSSGRLPRPLLRASWRSFQTRVT